MLRSFKFVLRELMLGVWASYTGSGNLAKKISRSYPVTHISAHSVSWEVIHLNSRFHHHSQSDVVGCVDPFSPRLPAQGTLDCCFRGQLPAALVAYVVVADLCVLTVILPILGEERAVVLFTDELVADGTFLSFL